MPKVSVIVPVYNVEQYLERCLNSLINQTLKDIEIICINDCSSDNSLKILEEYQKKDDRIKIIDLKENQGVSVARNKGLEIATGEYLGFVDPDDWIDLDYWEKMVEKIGDNNADLIVNINYVKEYGDKKAYSFFDYVKNEQFIDSRTAQRLLPPTVWGKIFKKSFIDCYKIRFPVGLMSEDIYFASISELRKEKIFVYKGPFYHYFQRLGSQMHQKVKGWHCILIFRLIYNYLIENNIDVNKIKLFTNESLILDNENKYNFTKSYLKEISSTIIENKECYNDLELFLFEILMNTENYSDFLERYNPNISISYIRNKMTTSKQLS